MTGGPVDWAELVALERRDPQAYDERLKRLVGDGILDFGKDGSYFLFGAGTHLGPAIGPASLELSFTGRKDAERYRDAKYANAMFDIGIRRIG